MDGVWDNVFSRDTLRESTEKFSGMTNGFSRRQVEWAATFFFRGVEHGARLSRDSDLERLVRDWIARELRPHGYVAAAAALGVSSKGSNDAEVGAYRGREGGDGASAASSGAPVS